jgi:hypothetical protein
MKKRLTLMLFLGLFGLLWAGCGKKEESASQTEQPAAAVEALAVFACAMHPEVVSAHPGKCNECGMDLEKRLDLAATMKVAYICPMNDQGGLPGEPGKCAGCGMDLNKTGVVISHLCTAHPEQVAAEAGKCALCQKKMVIDTAFVNLPAGS